MSHTAGPWEAGEWNTAKGGAWVNAGDAHICCVDGEAKDPMADARLIAAAPDLLAEAKALIDWINGKIGADTQSDLALHFLKMQMAISKAEGREP